MTDYIRGDLVWDNEGDFVKEIFLDPRSQKEVWDFMMDDTYSRDLRREIMQTVQEGQPQSEYDQLIDSGYTESDIVDWGKIPEDYYQATAQLVRDRIKTMNEDWDLYPEVGSDLEDLIGLPMTAFSAELGRDKIVRCLTYDKAIDLNDLEVLYFKGDPETILYVIQIRAQTGGVVKVIVPFSFTEGVFVLRELP